MLCPQSIGRLSYGASDFIAFIASGRNSNNLVIFELNLCVSMSNEGIRKEWTNNAYYYTLHQLKVMLTYVVYIQPTECHEA